MKKKLTGLAFAVALCMCPSLCFAGDINGNEASVYSAASGTFTYEGRDYVASPGYLSQLSAYLSRDDIDLSAEQASSAISQIYANVERGVTEGYIVPIGGETEEPIDATTAEEGQTDSDQEPSYEEIDEGVAAEGEDDTESETTNSPESVTQEPEAAEEANVDGTNFNGENVEETITTQQQSAIEETLQNRPESDQAADIAFTYDEETQTIIPQGNENEKIENIGIEEQILSPIYSYVKIAVIVAIVLMVVAGILLISKKCLCFQKNKGNSTHAARSIVRKITKPMLVVSLAASLLVAASSGIAQAGYFKSEAVTDALNDSGYYHDSFDAMMVEVHALLLASGSLENTCDTILDYETFRFTAMNRLQTELKGNESSATYEDIKSEIIETVGNIEYFTEESKEELADQILTIFEQKAETGIGTAVYAAKTSFWRELGAWFILAAITAILAIILMLTGEHYRHRGMKAVGVGCLIAGAVCIGIYIYQMVAQPYAAYYIKPDYLYVFFYRYMSSGARWYLIAGIVAAAAGAISLFSSGMMRRQKMNE